MNASDVKRRLAAVLFCSALPGVSFSAIIVPQSELTPSGGKYYTDIIAAASDASDHDRWGQCCERRFVPER